MSQDDGGSLRHRLQALERLAEHFQSELEQLRAEISSAEADVEDKPAPPPEVPAPPPPPKAPVIEKRATEDRANKALDIEFWLGGRGLLLIGVLALVFAVAFVVKEAMERGWVGPTFRVLLGAGVGVATIVAGERIRAAGYRIYGLWLAAGGFSAVYLSVWAATALYSLIPTSLGFILMVLTVAAAAALGLVRNSESFVALAAFGGYLAPLLLRVDNASNWFGLGYLALLSAAGLWLAYRSRWPYLATVAIAGGAVLSILSDGDPHLHGSYLVALMAGALLVARLRAWAAISALAVLVGWVCFWIGSSDWGIGGLTFSVYAGALWLACLIGSVGVSDWLNGEGNSSETSAPPRAALSDLPDLLGLVVTFLPPWFFYLSALAGVGDSAYSQWHDQVGLVLGVVLGSVYLAQAVFGPAGRGTAASVWRSALGYAFWIAAPLAIWENAAIVRAWLVEGIAFSAAGVAFKRIDARTAGLVAFSLAVLTFWGEVAARPDADAAFFGAWALTGLAASVGLGLWALALFRVEPANWEKSIRPFMLLAAAVFFLGWGTGEITRYYDLLGDEARWKLARDLSISGFWLAYASALLASGFWLQQPPVRWAGLGVALLAAAKVFMYDLSQLSRLYRIGSFVLLAVVLLALSFRYQKLRQQNDSETS
jgi:hypothetical protein